MNSSSLRAFISVLKRGSLLLDVSCMICTRTLILKSPDTSPTPKILHMPKSAILCIQNDITVMQIDNRSCNPLLNHSGLSSNLIYVNVWFPFMYSQKWNCYFQNRIIIFCFPVPTLIYLWEIYIFPGLTILLQKNMWTDPRNIYHRHMNVEIGGWGRAIPRKGIHKWDFLCSVAGPPLYRKQCARCKTHAA